MNRLSKLKGVMNWMLLGATVGLSIGIMRVLLNWDRAFANYVLLVTAGAIFLVYSIHMMVDYYRVKKFLNHYIALLDQRQFDAYIKAIHDAIDQTRTKSFKDIHRMNLAIGYSYKGLYEEAIEQLKTVYDSTKTNSKIWVFCLVNMIYFAVLKKDYWLATKLIQSHKEVLDMHEKDAQYGILINVNHAYLAMHQDDFKSAEQYLNQANRLFKTLNSGLLEVTRATIEYALACKDTELAKENIELFQSVDLPPAERAWIDSVVDQHKLSINE